MKKATICVATMMLAAFAATARAQLTKTLPGTLESLTVSVEAIERASREITVKKPDGTYETLYVPAEIKRFDTLKIGDKITAKYYETVVVRLQAPGQKPVNSDKADISRSANANAATLARQRTMTATITKIDPKAPSITLSGPNGWTYSKRVEDTKMLAQVKVGDKLDITWTEALVLSLEPGK